MENFLIITLAKLSDPVGLIVILIASFIISKRVPLLIFSVIVAVAIELLVANMNNSVQFGQALIQGILASLIHAFICSFIISKFKSKKPPNTQPTRSADLESSKDFDEWYSIVKKLAVNIEGSSVVEIDGLNILDMIDDAPARKAYEDKLSVEEYAEILATHFQMPDGP